MKFPYMQYSIYIHSVYRPHIKPIRNVLLYICV